MLQKYIKSRKALLVRTQEFSTLLETSFRYESLGRVVQVKVRGVRITENHFGFVPEQSTTEIIHLVRRSVEQDMVSKRDLHMVFINLERTSDKVSKGFLWRYLDVGGVPVAYSRVIKDMYDGLKIWVRTLGGDLEHFQVMMHLH